MKGVGLINCSVPEAAKGRERSAATARSIVGLLGATSTIPLTIVARATR